MEGKIKITDPSHPLNALHQYLKQCVALLTKQKSGKNPKNLKVGGMLSTPSDYKDTVKDWEYVLSRECDLLQTLVKAVVILEFFANTFVKLPELLELVSSISQFGLGSHVAYLNASGNTIFEGIIKPILDEELKDTSQVPLRSSASTRPIDSALIGDPSVEKIEQKVRKFVTERVKEAQSELNQARKAKSSTTDSPVIDDPVKTQVQKIVAKHYKKIIEFINDEITLNDLPHIYCLVCQYILNKSDVPENIRRHLATNVIFIRLINPVISKISTEYKSSKKEAEGIFVSAISEFIQFWVRTVKELNPAASEKQIEVKTKTTLKNHRFTYNDVSNFYSGVICVIQTLPMQRIQYYRQQISLSKPQLTPLSKLETHQLKSLFKWLKIKFQNEELLPEGTVRTIIDYFSNPENQVMLQVKESSILSKGTSVKASQIKPADIEEQPRSNRKWSLTTRFFEGFVLLAFDPEYKSFNLLDLLNILYGIHSNDPDHADVILLYICCKFPIGMVNQFIITVIESTDVRQQLQDENSLLFRLLYYRFRYDKDVQQFLYDCFVDTKQDKYKLNANSKSNPNFADKLLDSLIDNSERKDFEFIYKVASTLYLTLNQTKVNYKEETIETSEKTDTTTIKFVAAFVIKCVLLPTATGGKVSLQNISLLKNKCKPEHLASDDEYSQEVLKLFKLTTQGNAASSLKGEPVSNSELIDKERNSPYYLAKECIESLNNGNPYNPSTATLSNSRLVAINITAIAKSWKPPKKVEAISISEPTDFRHVQSETPTKPKRSASSPDLHSLELTETPVTQPQKPRRKMSLGNMPGISSFFSSRSSKPMLSLRGKKPSKIKTILEQIKETYTSIDQKETIDEDKLVQPLVTQVYSDCKSIPDNDKERQNKINAYSKEVYAEINQLEEPLKSIVKGKLISKLTLDHGLFEFQEPPSFGEESSFVGEDVTFFTPSNKLHPMFDAIAKLPDTYTLMLSGKSGKQELEESDKESLVFFLADTIKRYFENIESDGQKREKEIEDCGKQIWGKVDELEAPLKSIVREVLPKKLKGLKVEDFPDPPKPKKAMLSIKRNQS